MAKVVWRIAADTPSYQADELTGKGAELTGGRWNRKGVPLLYCASSISLACLETLVHLGGTHPLPLNRYLVEIQIPPAAWSKRMVFEPARHVGWDAEPPGKVSIEWGTRWAQSRRNLIAVVPSIIVPEEYNVLINPRHPNVARLKAKKIRRWTYDWRLSPAPRTV